MGTVSSKNKKGKIQSVQLSPCQTTKNRREKRRLENKKDVWMKTEWRRKLFFHQKTNPKTNVKAMVVTAMHVSIVSH